MTIKHIDRATCRMIQERVAKTLTELGKELGVEFKSAGGTYGGTNATIRMSCSVIGEGGTVETKERRSFQLGCRMFGLEADMLDRQFVSQGHTWTVVGLCPKSYKFPVLVRREDGKEFKMPADRVKLCLATAGASK